MISFPNAKINLGLYVTDRRPDGFHNLLTCFYPIYWCDVQEFLPAEKAIFTATGTSIEGNKADNLSLKAYKLLNERYQLPPLQIHLHKLIPMGAGLGGGSSDAAFMLRSLNDYFNLKISEEKLEAYAGQLGSDCPFFIRNHPVLAGETGNVFEPLALSLKGCFIMVIYPDIHLPTADAFSAITPAKPDTDLKKLLEGDRLLWQEQLKNDFEPYAFSRHPELEEIKQTLYEKGAFYASMSGSGSAIYGLFDKPVAFSELEEKRNYTVWSGMLTI